MIQSAIYRRNILLKIYAWFCFIYWLERFSFTSFLYVNIYEFTVFSHVLICPSMFRDERGFLTPGLCFSFLCHTSKWTRLIYWWIFLEMVRPTVNDIQGMYVAVQKTKFSQSSLVFKNCTCSLLTCVCMHVGICITVKEKERK